MVHQKGQNSLHTRWEYTSAQTLYLIRIFGTENLPYLVVIVVNQKDESTDESQRRLFTAAEKGAVGPYADSRGNLRENHE